MAHEEHIIQYLSKEIETHTNNLMVFRTRANLAVYLGPFVVFGYLIVATRSFSISVPPDPVTWAAVVLLCLCFLALGWTCGKVEEHTWDQCNRWRVIIAQLQKRPPPLLEDDRFVFKNRLMRAYMFAFFLLLLSLITIMTIITRLEVK